MDVFFVLSEAASVEAVLKEVFHGFYIVVGYGFDVFDLLSIGHGEVAIDVAQAIEGVGVNRCESGEGELS